jgi:hypothetical protein
MTNKVSAVSAQLQSLLANLEERFADADLDDTAWYPDYDMQLASDRIDVEPVFNGKIISRSSIGSEYEGFSFPVEHVEIESDAKLICDCVNAMPQLLDYIRHLEHAVERLERGHHD